MRRDSLASPPLENTPTMVHSLSRSATWSPISTPRNSACAPLPTIISRRPGLNVRPSMIWISGRTVPAAGSMPRTVSPARVPSSLRSKVHGHEHLRSRGGVALRRACDTRRVLDGGDGVDEHCARQFVVRSAPQARPRDPRGPCRRAYATGSVSSPARRPRRRRRPRCRLR